MLKGRKALRALNRLTVAKVSNYTEFKQAALKEYNLVPKAHRNKFRICVKRNGDSNTGLMQFLRSQFERWIASMHAVDDFERLKDILLIEQFMNKVPDDVKQFSLDKNCGTLHECVRKADEYTAVCKCMRIQQPKTQLPSLSRSNVNLNTKYEQKHTNNAQNSVHNTSYNTRLNNDITHFISYNSNKPGYLKKNFILTLFHVLINLLHSCLWYISIIATIISVLQSKGIEIMVQQ